MELKRYFLQSLTIHSGILLAFLIFPKIYSLVLGKSFSDDIKIIPQALRVDMVGMPTLTQKELRNLPKLKKNKIKVKTPPKIKENTKKEASPKIEKESKVNDKEAVAINSKKKDEKKSKQKTKKTSSRKEKKGSKVDKEAAEALKSLVLFGNQVSKGELATGDVSEADLGEFERYALKVKEKIREYWKLPSFLLELDLRSRVRVFINDSGKLIRYSFLERSGNEDYDRRVQQAIEYASPFEKPDKKIVESLESGSLVLVFPF